MGYSFAASLGAALAKPKGNAVCIIGDGGMNMNIQELQTIVNYNIPVKVIILNNHIYGITQGLSSNFEGRIELVDQLDITLLILLKLLRLIILKLSQLINWKILMKL